jgi:hypothetical protein
MCRVRATGLKAEGKTIIVDVVMQVKRAHQETAPQRKEHIKKPHLKPV